MKRLRIKKCPDVDKGARCPACGWAYIRHPDCPMNRPKAWNYGKRKAIARATNA